MAESAVFDSKSVRRTVISRQLAAAALLGATLSLAPPAWAEPEPAQESRTVSDPRPARELFAEAVGLAQQGQYAAAKAAFVRAYAREPHPRVLYNIGQCEVRLGQFGSAIDTLERFLASNGISGDERRAVELQVGEIRALVRGVSSSTQPEDPRMSQRPEPAPLAPILRADAVVPPGDAPSHVWSWVLGGAGMALLGSATALYLWNDTRHDEWKVERSELDLVRPRLPNGSRACSPRARAADKASKTCRGSLVSTDFRHCGLSSSATG
jgi:tetratricopeptide (TPR) repeat protein